MNRDEIKRVMIQYVEECRDPKTGEVNHTKLSELAAFDLNIYIDYRYYEIPQEIFEASLDFH